MNEIEKLEKIESIMKRRGFIWQSGELYGGLSGFYDYGHLGALVKRRFERTWRNYFLSLHPRFFEISPSLIMQEEVFEASGHLDHFTDPIVGCSKCNFAERADQLLSNEIGEKFEGLSREDLTDIIKKHNIKCPKCEGELNEVEEINLMFPIEIGPHKKTKGYLRPETAQGAYVNFYREFQALRKKLPIGLAIIGKAFRNEISPRQGVYRTREFTQAELQIFIDPEKINEHENWEEVKEQKIRVTTSESRNEVKEVTCNQLVEERGLPKFYVYHMAKIYDFYTEVLNYPKNKIRFFELNEEERAFYNKIHWDFEVELESHKGYAELCGIHYRTDYDLKSHEKRSNQKQEVFFDGKRFVPHVVELAFGVDRNVYSSLELSYREREGKSILSLPPKLSPFKCAVFPLVNKDGLDKKAMEVYSGIRKNFECFYDDSGSIGKRYARQDEIGTPLCITVDHDTLKDDSVTIRNRDTGKQVRVQIKKLRAKIEEFFSNS